MRISVAILTIFLCIFISIDRGNSLRCYHCIQPAGGDCDSPSKNDNFIKECPQADMVCFTQNTTNPSERKIERDCAPKTICDGKNNDKVTCDTCEDDLCNSSGNIMPYFMLSVYTFVILMIYNHLN